MAQLVIDSYTLELLDSADFWTLTRSGNGRHSVVVRCVGRVGSAYGKATRRQSESWSDVIQRAYGEAARAANGMAD
jgi:hypothetical protein